MILPDFKAFPRSGRIIGVDWGARRTGLAVSDVSREFVFVRPVMTGAENEDTWAQKIAAIAAEEKVVGIVIGMPVHADGGVSDTGNEIRRYALKLCTYSDLPICFIEENLTSVAAQESMGKVRVRDIKACLDSESARVILENAIAMINRM